MEHRTPEIQGALWWLERRAKGFARWTEHSGELKERFEIAIVDPVDSAEGGVLVLFAVGDVYVSFCKKSAYALFSARRRSRALFWL